MTCAYMLGHLEDAYQHICHWYVVESDDAVEAIVMVFTGHSVPVILTYGQTGGLEQVLNDSRSALPRRALAHLLPHHISVLDAHFETAGLVPMVRMSLEADEFKTPSDSLWSIEPLSHRHTGQIVALYEHYYADNWFDPAQLDSGHYCGILQDGELVSVAGVHAVSPKGRLAILGNIVTHPDYRGRGMSTACTAHIVGQLFESGIRIVALNVQRQNHSAVRVYEKLGFRYQGTFLEGMVSMAAPGTTTTP